MLASLLKLLLALATGEAGLTGALVELGLFLPHSRRAELEADASASRLGLTHRGVRPIAAPAHIALALSLSLATQSASSWPRALATTRLRRRVCSGRSAPRRRDALPRPGCPRTRPTRSV